MTPKYIGILKYEILKCKLYNDCKSTLFIGNIKAVQKQLFI